MSAGRWVPALMSGRRRRWRCYKLAKYWRRTTDVVRRPDAFTLDKLLEYDHEIREDQQMLQIVGLNPNITKGDRENIATLERSVLSLPSPSPASSFPRSL